MESFFANKPKLNKRKLRRIWKQVRPAAVLVLSVVIVYFVAQFAVNYVVDNFIKPVDTGDATPIEVTVPASASASSIARILYGACGYDQDGLISNTAAFKVYVDFVGKANTMKAGTYVLSKNMSIKQIVDVICEGNPPKATVKFTIPEGYTVRDMIAVLREKKLLIEDNELLGACKTGRNFTSFAFVSDVVNNAYFSQRDYALEGYLFPDTYEVYADASVDTILTKMLNRFNEIYTEAYATRARELGMTTDEVVALASLIEREAQVNTDFAKVSAVFHNRLREGMPLQSCASLSYVLDQNKYTFTESELATDSPYNTYKNKGLPIGPVCNPGKASIEAALYPNEEFLSDGYLFFCNGNLTESSELIFSKTYEEHQENVKKYQQYWN
ncbi:MAG: endolytic transglycosylase MltG [Clostridia bacterium]